MGRGRRRNVGHGPAGTRAVLGGKDGPQVIRSKGDRWTEEAEAAFLDQLAASCNVLAACEAAGFCNTTVYKRRREDAGFARRWQAALEQGYVRIEMALVRRAADALEGLAPDPDTPIPTMTVEQAIKVLDRHRAAVKGEARSKRNWTRPRTLDEVSESILRKLEAIAPEPVPLVVAADRPDGVGASGAGVSEAHPRPLPQAGGEGEVLAEADGR